MRFRRITSSCAAALAFACIACALLVVPSAHAQDKGPRFTPEEQEYIDNAPVLRAVSIDGGAPHHYFDSKGEIRGIAVSVLGEIAKISGLNLECALYPSITEALNADWDLAFGLSKQYVPPGVVLSEPYLRSEAILFYSSALNPAHLQHKTYAAVRGVTLPEGILESNTIYFDNREATFDAVETGKADYGYANAYSLAFYALQNGYKNMVSIPQEKEDRAYCVGLAEGNDILLSIVNKSIAAIEPTRIQTIVLEVTALTERKVTLPMVAETYGPQITVAALFVIAVLSYAVSSNIRANHRLKADIEIIAEREALIKHMSYHDSLTGLYNRAYFDEELTRLQRSASYPISIIIADVNGLKITNDVFGHLEGDRLLQNAADVLQKMCRKEDVVARYGGDEFVILLPNTPANTAAAVCRRIISACKSACADPISASISVGWATKTDAEQDMQDVIRAAEDMMYHNKLVESKATKTEIIASLEAAVHKRELETKQHTQRMVETVAKMGRRLNLADEEMHDLDLLTRLHDIGKITVDERILKKQGPLTENEFASVKKHSEAGYRIAEFSQVLSGISRYILHHHERWDGQGYPLGLKGEEIPLLSRILAIVDAYDVMTNDSVYRKAMSERDALDELRRCSGTQFDPNLVPVFLSIMEDA